MTTSQQAVLDILKQHGPMTDHALVPIVQHLHGERMSSSGIRSRRAELVDANKVKAADSIRTPSGRRAQVWEAV